MERGEGNSGLNKDIEHHKFSDFSKEAPRLEGKKKRIEEMFDKEILIIDYRISDSHFKDATYATIQFENGGTKYITFTGSEVLQKQLEKYSKDMPFYTTTIRRGRYYTFS